MIAFYIIFTLFIPAVMLACGYLMYKRPPKDINGLIGYRTERSMKNRETWEFAHDYCGRLWVRSGVLSLILSVIISVSYFYLDKSVSLGIMCVAEFVQTAIIIWSIFLTEKQLKLNFNDDGKRKDNL